MLKRFAIWLENCGLMRLFKAAGPAITVAGIIIALWLFYWTIKDREAAQIANAWQVIAASPGAEGGNIGQKAAVEFLNSKGADLSQINLASALLRHANLPGAVLRRAILIEAVLEHANLRSAKLWRVRLQRALLDGADLSGANLPGAFLQYSRLVDADLTGAVLTGANLTGANLTGAKVTREQLTTACADPRLPPKLDDAVKPDAPWPQECPAWTAD